MTDGTFSHAATSSLSEVIFTWYTKGAISESDFSVKIYTWILVFSENIIFKNKKDPD